MNDWTPAHRELAQRLRAVGPRVAASGFDTRTRDDHVVCRVCGRTEEVGRVAGVAPCLDPSRSAGFVVDEAEVVFRGLCPDCSRRRSEEGTT